MKLLRIATWNVQRPSRTGTLNPLRLDKIRQENADIWVLTETRDVISLDDGWHSFSSYPIPKYHHEGETLVTIWSKLPVKPVSASRFTACVEIKPEGGPNMLIYGTVIPWDKDEGFDPGRKPERWEEHRKQVQLQTCEWEVLARSYPTHLMCIAGDFNQHRDGVSKYRDPESVARVSTALGNVGMTCLTDGLRKELSKPLVDHICVSNTLTDSTTINILPYDEHPNLRLSDHHGVVATICRR